MNIIKIELSLQKALKVYFHSPSLSRDIKFTFQTLLVIISHHHHHLRNVSLSFSLTGDISFLLAKSAFQSQEPPAVLVVCGIHGGALPLLLRAKHQSFTKLPFQIHHLLTLFTAPVSPILT